MRPSTRRRKSTTYTLEPSLRIGKQGITEGVIRELKLQLKKKGTIKVKLLASSTGEGRDTVIDHIVSSTHATLIHKVGNVIVLKDSE